MVIKQIKSFSGSLTGAMSEKVALFLFSTHFKSMDSRILLYNIPTYKKFNPWSGLYIVFTDRTGCWSRS